MKKIFIFILLTFFCCVSDDDLKKSDAKVFDMFVGMTPTQIISALGVPASKDFNLSRKKDENGNYSKVYVSLFYRRHEYGGWSNEPVKINNSFYGEIIIFNFYREVMFQFRNNRCESWVAY